MTSQPDRSRFPPSSAMSRANRSEVVQSFDFGFGAGARRGTLLIGAKIGDRHQRSWRARAKCASASASSTSAAVCCCRPGRMALPPASPSRGICASCRLADRAAGLQLLRFSIDRDSVDVTLEASFAMAGLKGDTLGVDPRLPPQWRSLSFRVCWRGRSVAIGIAGNTVQATLVEGEGMEMRIGATTAKLAASAILQMSV